MSRSATPERATIRRASRPAHRRATAPATAAALLVAGAVWGAAAGVASSAAPVGADPEAVLRYAVPGVAQSMDPRTANEFQQVFLEQAYEPLIRTTPTGEYEAGLATDWTLVDDGAAFELTLREGVTFQDGEAFDADAVVANLDGTRAGEGNLAVDLAVVDSVTAVDESTVRLDLNGPGGHLPGVLAGYAGMMISPAALDSDLQTEPVGAGPFVLTGITETSVTFDRWDGYYGADEMTIGGLEFATFADESTRLRALVSGQLDGAFIAPAQVPEAEAQGLRIESLTRTSHHAVLLNTSNEILANDLVRQALMHAIDRQTISEALYGGRCVPSAQPYAPGFWAYVPELADAPQAEFDLELARRLLAEAGYADGFSITVTSNTVTIYQRLAEVLQQQWAEVGIDVEVRASTDLTSERRNGDFEVMVEPFEAGRPDPTVFFDNYYAPDGRLNFGGVVYPGVDDLIAEARASTDPADRSGPLADIITATLEQGPLLLPICVPETITAFRPGVGGLVTSVVGNRDFRRATVES